MPYDKNLCFLDHAFSLVFQFNIVIDNLHSFKQNFSPSVLVRLITLQYIDEKNITNIASKGIKFINSEFKKN